MTNESEKRTVQILIRVTPKEYKTIKSKAAKSGLNTSELIRQSVMDKTIVEAPPADFNELIREVKRVGSNLNQLLRKLNMMGIIHPLELERVIKNISDVTGILYQTYRPGKGDN